VSKKITAQKTSKATTNTTEQAANKKLPVAILAAVCLVGGASIYLSAKPEGTLQTVNTRSTTQSLTQSIPAPLSTDLNSKTATQTSHSPEPEIIAQTPRAFSGKAFAPSIEGTEIDGRLKADLNGNLIVDLEVRDMFDYFMNTVADVEPEVALAELEKLAREHLPASAADQAMALLDDYIAYKEAALTYSRKPLLPPDQQTIEYQISMLEQSFTQLKEIRRSTMSREAVDAFFGLEEAYGEYTIASIQIQSDTSLSSELKQAKLEQARAQLPPMVRETETRMHEDLEASEKVNTLLASDLSDSELERALAAEGLEEEAIKDALNYRLAQESFDEQYAQYAVERDQLKNSGLSESDMEPELERLRQRYFNSEKGLTQARVRDLSS
jgi:lipase chaperone LimK